jgi:hypothetical protein
MLSALSVSRRPVLSLRNRSLAPKGDGSMSFALCQYASKLSLQLAPKIDEPPTFEDFGSKLAVQERYKENLFLGVLRRSLQGIAERPLPCNYNLIQFVCALSQLKRYVFTTT